MHPFTLQQVSLNNLELLQQISKLTFYETFSPFNSEENMKKYLKEQLSLDKLKSELTEKESVFYFARYENKVLGYLKLNFGKAQTELQDDKAFEIERIYVIKEFHGKQVGQLLYDKAIQLAKERKAPFVWLGVWEENPRAIQFYKKNGFVEFDKHLFVLGEDKQTDLMMKLVLNY
jgi:diamine N-acetyltransferase